MRRRKSSYTSITSLREVHPPEISVDNLFGFLKRKIPAFGSLLIGIVVGLLVANLFGGNVRPCTDERD